MGPLKVQLLGGFALYEGDQPLPDLPTQKMKSLFGYLVTHRQSSHPREVLAELFWGDLGADKARNNLRYVLSMLRRTYGPYLLIDRYQVSFNAQSAYWLDVEEFEDLVVRSRGLSGPERFQALRRALDLYRGGFLVGFYEDWVLAEQERLKQLYLEVLEALALWSGGPFGGSPPLRKSEEAGLKRELARAQMRLYNPELALVFAEQALQLYKQSQDSLGQGQTYLLLGAIHRELGQNTKACECYQKALELSSLGDLRTQWRVLNNLGWLQWNLHHPRKAQVYYEQALTICRRLDERGGEALILNNLGIALLDTKEYTQALACFDRASEAIAIVGDEELRLENISYRALAYVGLQAWSEAERCIHDTLERLEAEARLTYHLSHKVHFNLWRVLRALGLSTPASQHLQRAYEDVMAHAQKIREAGLRESFLQGDRANQEIVTAWKPHKAS